MKLIIDTNVFVSGVFFSGPPFTILDAWRHGRVSLIISPEILNEYRRVGEKLNTQFPGVDLEPWIELLMIKTSLIDAHPLAERVCDDPDDDKLLACAVASRTKLICSGDKQLLDASGYKSVTVMKPRAFVDKYLKKR